jgi:hypothetical protein
MIPARNILKISLGGLLLGFVLASPYQTKAQDLFATLSSPNFDVRYLRGVEAAEAQKALDFLQAEYKDVTAKLGIEPKKKIEVRIYDNVGRYLAEAGMKKPWRGAIYLRGVIYSQPVRALVQRGIFESSLRFELCKAILEVAGERGCPLWLRECFAVYHTGTFREYTAPLGAKISAFSDLNQDIQSYPDPPQLEDVHYMLGQTMNYFIQKYGEKKTFSLFREFDGMRGLESVFKRVLGQDVATVEKGWSKFIAYHTTPFKK